MKGSARGKLDPREGQQPFRPNPNGVGDRTTTLRWLLIGAGTILELIGTILEFADYHWNYLKATYQIDINIQKLITINSYC